CALAAATHAAILSLHDALPIWYVAPHGDCLERGCGGRRCPRHAGARSGGDSEHAPTLSRTGRPITMAPHVRSCPRPGRRNVGSEDRKSTRLNSSHVKISYAVFC